MRRREFCKLIVAAAASNAMPAPGQAGDGGQSALPEGFNNLTQDYAQFCAIPANQRIYYTLKNGSVVETKLEEKTWQATDWGKPPDLPIPSGSWDGVPMISPIPGLSGDGPYSPTWDSLMQYEAPEWYRDAKFGIWCHWTPQCVPEAGDWYARNMYMEGSDQYKYQLAQYGHPSRFGYKELCAQWTLLNWDPDQLISRFKKAGAKLFLTVANHHDGFDTWNSKHQPWNATAIGPHRNILGDWAIAARNQGLRFGVTVHQARNWWWFQTAHGADRNGPMAGASYDGNLSEAAVTSEWWEGFDPQRLYGVKHPYDALPDISYVKNFYDRTRDVIDQHDPDLLYFDNSLLPLGWAGMNIGAYFYNHNLAKRGGKLEAVLNGKDVPDRIAKALVADYERGLTSGIMPYPWQSETCIGDWHYKRSLFDAPGQYGGYLSPRDVIHWLIDTVSKNGTFILNIPGRPDGTIDSKEIAVIDGITAWMEANSEAIYETRPWKIYGEGPNMVKSGKFQGDSVSKLGAKDIRFTRNKANTVVYAIALGWPTEPFVVQALGSAVATSPGRIVNVELLGSGAKIGWKQSPAGLSIEMQGNFQPISDLAASFKISMA
jgi:alpha-L-fucosidase